MTRERLDWTPRDVYSGLTAEERATRKLVAWQLRQEGLSFTEIGLRLGISSGHAHLLVGSFERMEGLSDG